MTLDEFVNLEMSPAKAFIIGMVFPLYTETTAANNRRYILAQVRHNAAYISEDDILEHHKIIKSFLRENNLVDKIQIVANQTQEYGNLAGAQRGFTLLIEKDKNESAENSFNKIYNEFKKLKDQSVDIQRYFLKGVFDGRGSMDTNSHLIVVDYRFDYGNSERILSNFSELVTSLGFELTPNGRHPGEGRNPQFRIKKKSLLKFKTEIGFFSVRRKNYLDAMLNDL